MTSEHRRDEAENELKQGAEQLFPTTWKRLERQPERKVALERALTPEGLQELARSRTAYILEYMMNPQYNYGKDDWFNFSRLLLPQHEGKDIVDPTVFWDQLGPERKRIALQAIGETVGLDLLEGTHVLIEYAKAEQDRNPNPNAQYTTSNPTNRFDFDVQLIWKADPLKPDGEVEYRFVKMTNEKSDQG